MVTQQKCPSFIKRPIKETWKNWLVISLVIGISVASLIYGMKYKELKTLEDNINGIRITFSDEFYIKVSWQPNVKHYDFNIDVLQMNSWEFDEQQIDAIVNYIKTHGSLNKSDGELMENLIGNQAFMCISILMYGYTNGSNLDFNYVIDYKSVRAFIPGIYIKLSNETNDYNDYDVMVSFDKAAEFIMSFIDEHNDLIETDNLTTIIKTLDNHLEINYIYIDCEDEENSYMIAKFNNQIINMTSQAIFL